MMRSFGLNNPLTMHRLPVELWSGARFIARRTIGVSQKVILAVGPACYLQACAACIQSQQALG
jgi:hypothetical protein